MKALFHISIFLNAAPYQSYGLLSSGMNTEHSLVYKKYMCSDEWRSKCEEVFSIRGRRCEACGSQKSIEVHHKTYGNLGYEPLDDLSVVCKNCHKKIHKLAKKTKDIWIATYRVLKK